VGVSADPGRARVIICSLNEVESYARRAARGAGMSWGLAEEAGKAARWLAARGLPGAELLLGVLRANDGRAYSSMVPAPARGPWQAAHGDLCPVCTGAVLGDRIDRLLGGEAIRLGAIACPLLLAPFLDRPAAVGKRCIELRWPRVKISIHARGLTLDCETQCAYLSERAEEVAISAISVSPGTPTHVARAAGVSTPLRVWRALDAFARRTYVPASAASRERGAGAGRTDDD
jgi:hypothetical protein